MGITNVINDVNYKSNKNYVTQENSNLFIFWHGLSGDELKNQVLTIVNKQTIKSWTFSELSSNYKSDQLVPFLKTQYVDLDEDDCTTCVEHIKNFLNDCSELYLKAQYNF